MKHPSIALVLFIGISLGLQVYSQEVTESSKLPVNTSPKVSFSKKAIRNISPSPAPPPPSNYVASFNTSSPAPTLGRSRKTVEFVHGSGITLGQLATIPNQSLDAQLKRSYLIAQETAANKPANEKYHPARASALDLVDFPTPKIQALADQLGGDVVAIFKYVRDQIRTEHQPKANKGAHMTLVLGSGGAGDKAALLFSLLRASGKVPGDEIRYANARIRLPYFSKFGYGLASLTGWSTESEQAGLPSAAELQALKVLANSGQDLTKNTETELVGIHREAIAYTLKDNAWTLISVPQTENYLDAERVWVKVKLGSEWINLDAAYPRRRWVDAPVNNQPSLENYDRNTFLNALASAPPAVSSSIANAGNIHRVGFSNYPEVRRRMKQYVDGFYDQYRSGGPMSEVSIDDLSSFLKEENAAINSIDDLKLFGCPWRIAALGAGISQPLASSLEESDFFPQAKHAWSLNWGWGQGKGDGRTRVIHGWTSQVAVLMPAMMGKPFTMEQNKTFNIVSGIATIKLGGDELHVARNTFEGEDYGLGTGGSDICVLSTEGLPLYKSGFSPADPMKNYQSSSLRPRVGDSSDITQSDFAPFAVYWPGANYLFAWSYLNVFSQDYLDECADRITHLRASGLKDDSTQVQLESMNLMISSYKYQWYGVSQLAASLSKYSSVSLHQSAAAFYWPESGIGIDAQNEYEASYFSRGEDFIKSGLGWIYSALEHGVIQQSQGGSSNRAMSTAKYLAKSNTTQPIYVFGAELKDPALGVGANANTVPPSSPAVPAAADVAKFKSGANNQYFDNIIQTYVANGVAGPISYNSWDASATLTIPWKNGSAVDGFNAWYVFAGDPYYGYWIGGHSGGLSGLLSRLNPLGVIGKFFSGLLQGLSGVSSPSSNSGSVNNPNAPNAKGNDPIDMRTGAYIYETTDLAVNAQPPLAFTRFYSSALSLDRSKGLGYGWSHNHIKRLALRSGLGGQFGETGRPEDAAAMITSILVLKDMLECIALDTEASTSAVVSERPARRFWNRTRSIIAASGIATWAVDELLDGDAVLTLGDKDYRFTRIPKEDGDYTKNVFFRSPVGMPEWKLSSNATGVFSMQRRYAGKMTFSALNAASGGYRLCTRDEDAYGNALVYAYRTDGFLSTVTSDPFPSGGTAGPNLTFSYFAATTTPVATAARLSSVKASTDQATLFLTYQDSTNYGKYLLQKARPPVCANAANHYFYNYDSQQRLTKTTDPQGRVVMENFYGGDDRVYRQLSEGLATQEWLYEWEPGISREINPKGHTTEFRYDDRSRLVGVKDNEDKLTSLVLDDEDRVVEVKGPEGQTLTRSIYFSALVHDLGRPIPEQVANGYGDPDRDPREGVLLSQTQFAVWNGSTAQTGTDISFSPQAAAQDIVTTYEYKNESKPAFMGLPTAIVSTGQGRTTFVYSTGPDPYQIFDAQVGWTQYDRDARGNVTLESGGTGTVPTEFRPLPNSLLASARYSIARVFDTRGRLLDEWKRDLTNSSDLSRSYFNWNFEPHRLEGPSAMIETRTGLGFIFSSANYQNVLEPASALATPPSIPALVVQQFAGRMQRSSTGVISLVSGATTYNTTSIYNAFGDLIQFFDGSGDDGFERTSSTQYNALGKPIRSVAPQTEAGTPVSTVSYDERGWQKTATDSLNRTVTTTRSFLDRPDVISNPLNQSVSTEFDSLNRVKKIISPMLRETEMSHVGYSSLSQTTTDALDHVTTSWHNAQGKQVAMTDRNNKQWRFAYDNLGRPTATRKPTGEMIRNNWRAGRNVLDSAVEPSGQQTSFVAYAGDDRLLRKKDGVNAGTSETIYNYDAGLRLTSTVENGKTVSRSYNDSNLGQLANYSNERGQTFNYECRTDGLLKMITYPADENVTVTMPGGATRLLSFNSPIAIIRKSVRYEYDSHKRLIKVIDWANRITQYKYDLAGRLKKIIRHNGSVCDMAYDEIDRLKEIKDSWAADGRLISLFRLGFNADSHLTGRLAVPYAYGLSGTPFAATYGDDNRMLTVNTQATTHDLDGNLLTSADPLYSGSMNLAYDSRNRLTNGTVKGVIGSYGYDAEGVRQTATFDGVTTTYTTSTHTALSQVLKRVSTGGKVTWCVYGLGLLYEVEPDLSAMTVVANSYPPSYKAAEKTLVHHHDQIGNTVAVTDDQQRDVLWVQYDIYGAVVHAESPTQRTGATPVRPEINTMPDKLARALAVTPYLFSGQQGVLTDPNGLLYMRARYYHPGLRRFVNPDPIGFEGGSNWYGYAGGNPLMANDPSGLAVRNAGRAVGNAIVGAAKSGLDYLIGRNAGAAWGRVLTDFGGWKEDAQSRIGRLLDGVFEETGIDPAINDNKFGHAAQAQDSQKEFGLIGTPLVTIGGLLYELFHILAPGHPQNGHSTGWGGPSPFFGTFDGQFPSNWLYDTPGDLLGNTLGQLGGILNMDSGSWNKGGYLIPGPNYSNGASYLSPVWPGAANPFR